MTHCCEAPRSMLSNYFCKKKQVLRSAFGEIWRIQIQMYPQTLIKLKYGAFNSALGLWLLVQLLGQCRLTLATLCNSDL